MFNVVTDAQFAIITQRWEDWLANDLNGVDPRIVESLKKFNEFTGVCSTWSCSGHTQGEYEARNDMKHYSDRQKRNIIFVINKEGGWLMDAFELFMAKLDRDAWGLYRPEIRSFLLSWAFDVDPATGRTKLSSELYPSWQIVMSYNNIGDSSSEVSKIIHDGLEQTWNEMIDFFATYHQEFVK
jgi:hypothetical protein